MLVEVWADVVCPWCYLGGARLRRAVREHARGDEITFVHRAFELNPALPRGAGEPVLEMLVQRYGMPMDQARAAEDRVGGLARAEGLPFSSGRTTGSTLDAHRLLALAGQHDLAEALLWSMYAAYFGRGESVFDEASLQSLAVAEGLDEARVAEVLAGREFTDEVRADERTAAEIGVSGVPFVVLDGRLGVPGAQEPGLYARALDEAFATHGA
jgi:predicted DsbA family dithiol-disulfide isomerase